MIFEMLIMRARLDTCDFWSRITVVAPSLTNIILVRFTVRCLRMLSSSAIFFQREEHHNDSIMLLRSESNSCTLLFWSEEEAKCFWSFRKLQLNCKRLALSFFLSFSFFSDSLRLRLLNFQQKRLGVSPPRVLTTVYTEAMKVLNSFGLASRKLVRQSKAAPLLPLLAEGSPLC